MQPSRIRSAETADLPRITEIYAGEVLRGRASFEEVPPDVAEMTRRWRDLRGAGFPYLVAERGGQVLGYAYAGPYRARTAYRYTVENSVYVAAEVRGQGVAGGLLEALIAACEAGRWRQMVAVIGDSANAASIALHARAGFVHVGTLKSVGRKHGVWLDTVLMQRALGPGDGTDPAD